MPLLLSAPYRRVRDLLSNDGVIRSLDQATPARLTRILREAQLLDGERVTAVTVSATKPLLARLELQFSGRVSPDVPRRLFLKMLTPDAIRNSGRDRALREVEFYSLVTATLTPSLHEMGVVRCIDIARDPDGPAHLMLPDLSETHTTPEWPIPPQAAQVQDLVDWTAALHATWWEDPALLRLPRLTPPLEWMVSVADRFLAAVADRVSDVEAARMRAIYRSIDGIWQRGFIGPPPARGFVLTHGDLHLWNALYPTSPASRLAVVDWQEWSVGHPLTEAAYLIGLNWDRSRDPSGERILVERYHRGLVASGRPVYSWDECWRGYRVAVVALFLVPAVFWDRKFGASVWWPQLRRLHAAYEQLRCDEVLSDLR